MLGPPWMYRHATPYLGFHGSRQPAGVNVAVTFATPSTWTTCGGDSVKLHGPGGIGRLGVRATRACNSAVSTTVEVNPITMAARFIPGS